ncbi:MAG: multicopper oxidase family protein [Thalassobaculum sp.]|uniref:multicopper oxidase family protein n=1 Tax=Thalassobaculum sp. TaxID=2022740 RepID=UPI0032EE5AEF
MKRRDFLLTGAAAWVVAPAVAHGHSGHDHGKAGMPAKPELLEGNPFEDLSPLANESVAPGLFEAQLRAGPATVRYLPGVETPVLAYNDLCPGPMIEATEGDRVRIDFRNGIPDQPSTIHWHGMQVPADQDGNPQDIVASGSGRFYEFTLPEGSAGSYWYHPHPHGLTAEQFYRGLNGVFLVKPKVDPIPAAYGDTVLFMTDLRLAADGTMPPSTPADMMNGRVGDHVLVNGQKNPLLVVSAGTRRRFRLYNAMNGRYLRLTFGDAAMTVIGTDGGLLEAPVPGVSEVLLVPGERMEVVVAFDQPGTATLRTLPYDRGWMGPGVPDDGDMALLTVAVTAATAPAEMPPLPAVLRSIPALGAPVVTRRFEFGEVMPGHMHHGAGHGMATMAAGAKPVDAAAGGAATMTGMAGHDHGAMMAKSPAAETKAMPAMGGHDHAAMTEAGKGMAATGNPPDPGMGMAFQINGKTFDMHRVDIRPKVGDVELWEIVNPTDMDHPFHVHGTQFQIVEFEDAGGVRKPPYRAWKDVVNVRPGETARFLIRQDMPGLRLYHCHILEHGQLGMMANAEVVAVG